MASTCDSSLTVSHNNTYVRNPSYPSALSSSTSTQTCGYKVQKLNDQICQLRLDFENLELGQTASSGVCTDTLQVTASVDSPATSVSDPALVTSLNCLSQECLPSCLRHLLRSPHVRPPRLHRGHHGGPEGDGGGQRQHRQVEHLDQAGGVQHGLDRP